MSFYEYKPGKEYIARLDHFADLLEAITELAQNTKIKAGRFTAIGALKNAKIGYYNQDMKKYEDIVFNQHCELAACIGNVSLKDGGVFVHAHVVLSDDAGNSKSGHLISGRVFAAEVHLTELTGPDLERKYDGLTGLSLWDIK
ncbi:MAG: DNA-binding protein [Chloroflexi bacterium]|nr:DNA-binding protein [Chloroflexota bacterium]MBT7081195.1 DNA-binding protein [Chloroflexota bacterium]MBT7290861.1 DNA-binding protein [Chloroflexota bacterium]